MRRKDAIERYISRNPLAQSMVKRLMMWDEKKTFQENLITLKVPFKNRTSMRTWIFRYRLKFKKAPHHPQWKGRPIPARSLRARLFKELRARNWTLETIGEVFGLSYERVRQELEYFSRYNP